MKWFALLLSAVFLAGCYYSEEELITRSLAGEPMEEGYFTHAPVDPETGEEWAGSTWEGEIHYGFNRRYYSRVENFPHQDARFRSLGGDVWLAQVPARDGPEAYSFGLLWVYEDGVIAYHIPDCTALSESVRLELGVEADEEGLCQIDDLQTIEQAMSAYLREYHEAGFRIDGIYRRVSE